MPLSPVNVEHAVLCHRPLVACLGLLLEQIDGLSLQAGTVGYARSILGLACEDPQELAAYQSQAEELATLRKRLARLEPLVDAMLSALEATEAVSLHRADCPTCSLFPASRCEKKIHLEARAADRVAAALARVKGGA